ncbi:MAG: double-strand break repair helicase AddA [Proteobacteria bacterium]|nr:double-strand break repair helicase AddA [Pseudomonadota bacterium]
MVSARASSELQQRRAADPAASVWVEASAGTGKTKVLVDRVLNLLLAGAPPTKLLCLTFTKAAAKEMANRLTARLSEWAVIEDEPLRQALLMLTGSRPSAERLAHARRLFAAVVDAPGGLRIDTIHAFCQSLLRRFPLEAGLTPHFEVLDARSASELLAEALEQVLGRAQSPRDAALTAALTTVVAATDELSFGKILSTFVAERGRLQRMLERCRNADGVAAALRNRVGLAADETEASILAAACSDGAFDAAGLRRAATALVSGSANDRKYGAPLAAWLDSPARRVELFDEYCRTFFTKEGDRRQKFATQGTLKAAPGIDVVLAREAERLEAVIDRAKAAANLAATVALVRLGSAIIERYRAIKAARSALDYDDLILATHRLLRRPGIAPWVLYKLDGGIDHILVDEAQDTNPEQWEVVAALAEEFFTGVGAREVERTVFAVGDAKQSIFSFQRADPKAFLRMRDHFAQQAHAAEKNWRNVPLTLSFRSTKAVLDAVDAVFRQPGASAGVVLDGGEVKHELHRQGEGGLVELWPPVAPRPAAAPAPWDPAVDRLDEDSPPARLAALIARKIAGWIKGEERLESQGRRIRPSDVMILVRQRNRLVVELVRALKRNKIPVAGVDRMVLAEQLAVMDLIALGHFLLLPEDDLTLATVLKGPLFNLTEEQLHTLAHARKGTLWGELVRRAGEDAAFAAARSELGDLLARVDYLRPYELYAELLGARGGRRRIVARLGVEADDPLDEFLAAALAFEQSHPPALETFLHWLVAGGEEIKRDVEAAERDEVRIMTVHGAKGLQAPIVILPDTMQVPQHRPTLLWPSDLVWWSPRTSGDDALARSLRADSRQAATEEYRRLLYVAMTRAQDRLYVFGYKGDKEPPAECWYNLIESGLRPVAERHEVAAAPDPSGPSLRLVCLQTGETPSFEEPAGPMPKSGLPGWWRRSPQAEPVPPRPLVPSAPQGPEPPVRGPFAGDDGRRFRRGRLIHRLLQTLPELPAERRHAAARAFLRRPVHGLPAAEREEIAAAAFGVLDHPALAPLFGPGSLAEAAIVGRIGDRLLSGQVDRLMVTDRDVLVLDYKTNRPAPATLAEVAPLYLAQMAAYRAALRQVYPGRRVRSALLWTDGPRLMELPDEVLDESGFLY